MKKVSRPQYARIRRILEVIREDRQGLVPCPPTQQQPEEIRVYEYVYECECAIRLVEMVFAAYSRTLTLTRTRLSPHGLRSDGSFQVELTFETTGWKELVRWVLSWQPDVRVLAPKALRDRVRVKLQQALKSPL
jgi:predicted DNA-binding transcriptional regulator YafY